LDAVDALRPPGGARDSAGPGRRHRLLVRRYVDGLPAAAVQRELALSPSHYFREHRRALEAVATVLREQRLAAEGYPPEAAGAAEGGQGTSPGGAPGPAGDRAGRLPAPLTSFVGRERELAEVARLLGVARLLTLTGPGGVGKTRLALRLAEGAAAGFPDGVWLVELAQVADPDLVAAAVAQALGVREGGGRSMPETLAAHLRATCLLLVLDNLEHLLPAARLVSDLLRAAPGLKVLATSREPLRLSGEQEFPVPPLALEAAADSADPTALVSGEAARLFVERARAVQPDFAPSGATAAAVAAICRRLDGLPLAIELAAARVRLLPPEALLARLEAAAGALPLLTGGPRDAPARHRTLRAALAWSHDLLTGGEQALFRRLAVFAGGSTIAAAEAICRTGEGGRGPGEAGPAIGETGAGGGDGTVVDGLAALLERSLLQRQRGPAGASRVGMLETVREYAAEQLQASGDDGALRGRHAAYYVALLEQSGPELPGPDKVAWYDRLERDLPNLRQALDWCLAHEPMTGLRAFASHQWLFWLERGYRAEGRRLEALLAAAPGRTAVRARALVGAAWFAAARQDTGAARAHADQAAAIARELGDPWPRAWATLVLGVLAWQRDRDAAAERTLLEESQALLQAAGDEYGIRRARDLLAEHFLRLGDRERVKALLEASVAHARETGNRWIVGPKLGLGRLARQEGDHRRAKELITESLAVLREIGHRHWMRGALFELGLLARSEGDFACARAHFEEARALCRELDDTRGEEQLRREVEELDRLHSGSGYC
jgi:predicted ATPase